MIKGRSDLCRSQIIHMVDYQNIELSVTLNTNVIATGSYHENPGD
ncbi:hypothetical protein HNQ59_001240 [Chitinivorax tropicus]|uniref:Uncharacterized protein n=1 Tax=Chitinivorax tropicus TaxID=714531 RepID=A0A840MKC9_9PROT|nr:hypothetical protein [Chitinivorax tropicus]